MARKRYSSDPKERARQLVAEGKIGGARPGSGRPRKDRTQTGDHLPTAASVVAKAARENADKIVAVFEDAVEAGQADRTRLAAAKSWLGVEGEEAEREIRQAEAEVERQALESMSRDELVESLAAMFARTPALAALLRSAPQPALEVAGAEPS
jgi:hypothetical protein